MQRIFREVGTFLSAPKRNRVTVAAGDELDAGELAAVLPQPESLQGSKMCFIFTRHVGCPFAQVGVW